jgi:hypothetical protein
MYVSVVCVRACEKQIMIELNKLFAALPKKEILKDTAQ